MVYNALFYNIVQSSNKMSAKKTTSLSNSQKTFRSKSGKKSTESKSPSNSSLIKNYGLFWKAEDVHWGLPNNPGNLYGKKSNSSTPVDFRDQTGIYVLYADYKIVYIGQAGKGASTNLFTRLRQHRTDDLAGRWNQFSWFGLKSVLKSNVLSNDKQKHIHEKSEVLDHFEAILIHTIEPPLNRQGGKWGQATHFLQHRDNKNLEPTPSELLNKILLEIKHLKKIKTL